MKIVRKWTVFGNASTALLICLLMKPSPAKVSVMSLKISCLRCLMALKSLLVLLSLSQLTFANERPRWNAFILYSYTSASPKLGNTPYTSLKSWRHVSQVLRNRTSSCCRLYTSCYTPSSPKFWLHLLKRKLSWRTYYSSTSFPRAT